jgi:hypothetical protein
VAFVLGPSDVEFATSNGLSVCCYVVLLKIVTLFLSFVRLENILQYERETNQEKSLTEYKANLSVYSSNVGIKHLSRFKMDSFGLIRGTKS